MKSDFGFNDGQDYSKKKNKNKYLKKKMAKKIDKQKNSRPKRMRPELEDYDDEEYFSPHNKKRR